MLLSRNDIRVHDFKNLALLALTWARKYPIQRQSSRRETCGSSLGGMPERLKGTGCKPVGYAYVGSNPTSSTTGHPIELPGLSRVRPEVQEYGWADWIDLRFDDTGAAVVTCFRAGVAQW